MRLLLVQPLPYDYEFGGGSKANRVLMELLAERGHVCKVFTPLQPYGIGSRSSLTERLKAQGATARLLGEELVWWLNGVEIHSAEVTGPWRKHLDDLVEQLAPDVILVSEDRSLALLQAVLDRGAAVVWIAQSPIGLPFGLGAHHDPAPAVELMRRLTAIATLSQSMASHIASSTGLAPVVIRVPLYGPGPFPLRADGRGRFVTLINPCAIKGISIFLELAESRPDLDFAAVPSWATTPSDLRAIRQLSNVTILPASPDVSKIYAQTRVLLVPSLWLEAFGYVVVEAMLRGIPVLASNAGGLPEAKLGVDYVIDVRGIQEYDRNVDEVGLPVPVVPVQDLSPWLAALRELDDVETHDALSRRSATEAARFAAGVRIEPIEGLLSRAAGHAVGGS